MTIKVSKKSKKNVKNNNTVFGHFLIKEIFEQPDVIKNIIEEYVDTRKKQIILSDPEGRTKRIAKINRIMILACGTSYHAGMIGKYLFSEYLGIEAELEYADEFIGRKVQTDKNTLAILLSQSGQSNDVLEAAKRLRKRKSFMWCITNMPNSALDKFCDFALYCQAGEEKSVAATKTFTAEVVLLALLAIVFGRETKKISPLNSGKILQAAVSIPLKIKKILKQQINFQILANKIYKTEHLLFVGKNYQYAAAQEAALKFKETSYLHAEGFALGEFLHGPLALADKKHPCWIFAPKDESYKEALDLIKKLKAARIKNFAITTENNKQLIKFSDHVIYIPKTLRAFYPVLGMVVIQMLAYHIAVLRGLNPDKPRNLKKFVE